MKTAEGFKDYGYPDASIDEEELEEGATSLHISLTGDDAFSRRPERERQRSMSV